MSWRNSRQVVVATTGLLVVAAVAGTAGSGRQEVTVVLPSNVPLVLVRILAGTFTMDSPTSESSREHDETAHQANPDAGLLFRQVRGHAGAVAGAQYDLTIAQLDRVATMRCCPSALTIVPSLKRSPVVSTNSLPATPPHCYLATDDPETRAARVEEHLRGMGAEWK